MDFNCGHALADNYIKIKVNLLIRSSVKQKAKIQVKKIKHNRHYINAIAFFYNETILVIKFKGPIKVNRLFIIKK